VVTLRRGRWGAMGGVDHQERGVLASCAGGGYPGRRPGHGRPVPGPQGGAERRDLQPRVPDQVRATRPWLARIGRWGPPAAVALQFGVQGTSGATGFMAATRGFYCLSLPPHSPLLRETRSRLLLPSACSRVLRRTRRCLLCLPHLVGCSGVMRECRWSLVSSMATPPMSPRKPQPPGEAATAQAGSVHGTESDEKVLEAARRLLPRAADPQRNLEQLQSLASAESSLSKRCCPRVLGGGENAGKSKGFEVPHSLCLHGHGVPGSVDVASASSGSNWQDRS
jgi:hypothetical protein